MLRRRALIACGSLLLIAAAPQVVVDGEPAGVTQDELGLVSFDCRPEALAPELARICGVARRLEGQRLFDEETFGGNGRTCATCHSRETGTFSASDAQARLTANPNDPLFRHDGFDDGANGLSRITQYATVRIELPLPAYVTLKDDPARRSIVVQRGTPATLNTPALETVFMHDLRNATLEEQALGAIEGHAKNTIPPTPLQLQLIAEFERRSPRFFSSPAMRRFAEGGPAPALPPGETQSQKRGRLFFVEAPFTRGAKNGICALCHSGPMLNQGSQMLSNVVAGAPPGIRDATVFVSERNKMGNPVYKFLIDDGVGHQVEMSSPDPGEILSPSRLPPPGVFPRTTFFNFFKIGTLWGIPKTSPYFHDGSAKTLEDVVEQYEFFFKDNPFGLITTLTEEDKKDIVEYLKLL